MQDPFRHTRMPAHTLPQVPQFCGSLLRSVHEPRQFVRPDGQSQTPPVHAPEAQMTPQLPQFLGSLPRFLQIPPQFVRPVGQLAVQPRHGRVVSSQLES